MRKPFTAVVALEWLLAAVNTNVFLSAKNSKLVADSSTKNHILRFTYFQMMLKFERFVAMRTLEFTQNRALVVTDHMSLQSIHISERFVAHLTRLKQSSKASLNIVTPRHRNERDRNTSYPRKYHAHVPS